MKAMTMVQQHVESIRSANPGRQPYLELRICTWRTLNSKEDVATVRPVQTGGAKLNLREAAEFCGLLLCSAIAVSAQDPFR